MIVAPLPSTVMAFAAACMLRLHTLLILLLALLLAWHPGAFATDIRAEQLAAGCAACHGTNGQSAGGTIPGLAGGPESDIKLKLREFKAGSRPATLMHQLAKGYSDDQINALAEFFARQPAAPDRATMK